MLESKQHTHLGHFLDFYRPNTINDLLKRFLMALVYFCRPEDTTDKVGYWKSATTSLATNRTGSTIKVVLWVVLSITFALALGQLH